MATTLFALDIGTRSVVGVILKLDGETYHVADLIAIEHKERSMIDGQIHNILSVANVITEIKDKLEEKHGPLKKVSVAAAGRALKTVVGTMKVDLSKTSLLSTEDINRLELAAVQQAQEKLLSSGSVTKNEYYYCVGYSVIHYKLDDEKIGNLIDQIGRYASVDVISTFLPQVVVESLMAALKRSGLEMEALTLEPIAAIQVLVPPSMRRLNVALVDIGAGTSDIAITDHDTVIAYGMVPLAGDEITERLSSEYLLDFPLAEHVKRALSVNDHVIITDILGFEQTLPSQDVGSIIQPTIQHLAKSIASKILELNNGTSPKAVILVGGGSLTPGLPKEISTYLDLPENRVGIRGLEALSGVTIEPDIGKSPDLVTPIGIAIAGRRAPIHYMTITVNGKTIRLFELKEMNVGDALLATNITARQLYGKPGLGMTVTVNGKDLIIPGQHGTPSTFLLNGKTASLKDLVKNGDSIELLLGNDGQDARATTNDLFEDTTSIEVTINGKALQLERVISINGEQQENDTSIKDRDKIVFSEENTIATALLKVYDSTIKTNNKFIVYVNKKPVAIPNQADQILLNNLPTTETHLLVDGDEITIRKQDYPTAAEVAHEAGEKVVDKINVFFNNKETVIEKIRFSFILDGKPVDMNAPVKPNDQLELINVNKSAIVFSDVFAFTDYKLPENTTGTYKLLRNEQPIGFNDPIFGGDNLVISFVN